MTETNDKDEILACTSVTSIGYQVPIAVQQKLKKHLNMMIGWNLIDESPIANCIPMSKTDVDKIVDMPHFVYEKPDGIRYVYI